MNNENSDTHNPLSESELNDRLNFAKMLDRQQDQIHQTEHIFDLIQPTAKVDKDLKGSKPFGSTKPLSEKNKLEKRPDANQISEEMVINRLDQIEGLVQSLVSKSNEKEETQALPVVTSKDSFGNKLLDTFEKMPIKKIQISNPKPFYALASSILIFGVLISINNGTQTEQAQITPKPEVKVIYKEKPTQPILPRYVLTKFLNIRTSPSSKGAKLTILSPNSIVDVLETKAGWHKIKFVDHVKGKTITGWAFGENLKKIN